MRDCRGSGALVSLWAACEASVALQGDPFIHECAGGALLGAARVTASEKERPAARLGPRTALLARCAPLISRRSPPPLPFRALEHYCPYYPSRRHSTSTTTLRDPLHWIRLATSRTTPNHRPMCSRPNRTLLLLPAVAAPLYSSSFLEPPSSFGLDHLR